MMTDGLLLSLHRGASASGPESLVNGELLNRNLIADDTSMNHLIEKILRELTYRENYSLSTTTERALLGAMVIIKTLSHQTRDALRSYEEELKKVSSLVFQTRDTLHSHEEQLKKVRKWQSRTDSDLDLVMEVYSSTNFEYLVNQPDVVPSNPLAIVSGNFIYYTSTVLIGVLISSLVALAVEEPRIYCLEQYSRRNEAYGGVSVCRAPSC